ncbi:hypothetical protein LEP1GSC188_4967 [Leptospira weilii serovar Topaz str. LT2116]|uniref:Uncharacterized protein n=1 Tax=Leptospira weilii serovar Topaz str. LT2116 TaxID=1088540 RepID=M3GWV7_9LEPT|nr:hypothetical protein LEP1GSC188_4967 [Leptospira weilii serovar Topaz str. LT2116]
MRFLSRKDFLQFLRKKGLELQTKDWRDFSGNFYWKNQRYFITKSLARERIGFEPVKDGLWRIYFSFVTIGYFDERIRKVTRTLKV